MKSVDPRRNTMKRLALTVAVVAALAATLLSSTALAGFRGGAAAPTMIRVHKAGPTPFKRAGVADPFKHSGVADPFKHSGVADPFKRAIVGLGSRGGRYPASLGVIS
jgi:hypothetical protein